MMFRIAIILAALVAVITCQDYNNRQNQKPVAIISEQRYLSEGGKFGSAYTQEDGINFKEETDSEGTRHGSYSYVDPTGQRRTVSYTAGKNGFQPTGDHLPVPPPAPAPTPGYQPQPQYQSPPQYQPQNNNYQQPRGDYDDGSYDTRYNNPSYDQPSYNPAPQRPAYNPPPQQPAYNPPPQQPAYNPQPQQQQSYNPPPQQYNPQYNQQATTQNPYRFKPPGKLSLSRTPDGFSFSFNKV